ncbi:MAG: hypothetical protein KDA41_22745 [Planctomycetales bacterium]|nr:hypothetical protein [Planctomycetales bacterium]
MNRSVVMQAVMFLAVLALAVFAADGAAYAGHRSHCGQGCQSGCQTGCVQSGCAQSGCGHVGCGGCQSGCAHAGCGGCQSGCAHAGCGGGCSSCGGESGGTVIQEQVSPTQGAPKGGDAVPDAPAKADGDAAASNQPTRVFFRTVVFRR